MARHLHMSLRGITRMGITTYRIGVNYLIIIVDLLIDILILCYLCFFWFFFFVWDEHSSNSNWGGDGGLRCFFFFMRFFEVGIIGLFFQFTCSFGSVRCIFRGGWVLHLIGRVSWSGRDAVVSLALSLCLCLCSTRLTS